MKVGTNAFGNVLGIHLPARRLHARPASGAVVMGGGLSQKQQALPWAPRAPVRASNWGVG